MVKVGKKVNIEKLGKWENGKMVKNGKSDKGGKIRKMVKIKKLKK